MNPRIRARFDRQVDWVLKRVPQQVRDLLEEVRLHVEDHPSAAVMKAMDCRYRDELCGYYEGISLDRKSIEQSGTLPDTVTLFREGIIAAASDRRGRVTIDRLRAEIRITLLHELAHHHGIDEEELRNLGYG